MIEAKGSSIHWVVGVVLLITGVLMMSAITVTFTRAQGVNGPTNANVNINNGAPTIMDQLWAITNNVPGWTPSYNLWHDDGAGGYTLFSDGDVVPGIVGGGMNVVININVTDSNGYDNQIINVSARLARTKDERANTNSISGSNNPFTYAVTNQTALLPMSGPVACTGASYFNDTGVNTGRTWRCQIPLFYVSDPTADSTSVDATTAFPLEEWVFLLAASDGIATTGPRTSRAEGTQNPTFEYDNIMGLSVDPYIDFGQAKTDGVPTAVVPATVENKGNLMIDIDVESSELTDAAAWACTGGHPLVSDVHLAPEDTDTNYNVMDPLVFYNEFDWGFVETEFDLPRGEVITTPSDRDENFRFATTQPVTAGVCTLSAILVFALQGY